MRGPLTHSQQKLIARATPIVERLPAGKPSVVEIGVFKGQLAAYLLDRRPDLTWIGVDNWLPREKQPKAYIATEDTHARATQDQQTSWRAEAYATIGRYGYRAKIMEMDSLEAARIIAPASADLVFIDADHSYGGCLADLRAWLPAVKPGGWLCGHDYGNPDPRFLYGVNRAVDEFAVETGLPLCLDGGHTYWFRLPL